MRLWTSPVLLLIATLLVHSDVMAVDPGEDFEGYMEGLDQRRQGEEAYRARLHAHETWRQTTWGGWTTRQLQAVGNHFVPFFEALADTIAAEEDSPGSMILRVVIRILVISSWVVGAFALAKAVNMITGQEIVVEEVIVVEDDEDGNEHESKNKQEAKKRK